MSTYYFLRTAAPAMQMRSAADRLQIGCRWCCAPALSAYACTPHELDAPRPRARHKLDAGRAVEFPLRKGRQAYLLCVEGTLSAGGGATDDDAPIRLARHDAAEWRGEGTLRLAAEEGAPGHLLLIEMAEGAGGRGPGQWPLHM